MRPYMCTPHSRQAYRWITALGSTTRNLSPLAVTLRFSRGTTATIENSAPSGFQHLVQPQTWLCAHCPLICTCTGLLVHRHVKVPPENVSTCIFRTPPSTDG